MKRLFYALMVLLPLIGLGLFCSSGAAPATAPVAWETESWTTSEKPYHEAEKQVLQSLNTKDVELMKRVYARLEGQAEAQPSDVMAQFKQAVALSRLALRGLDFPHTNRLRKRLAQLSPHSYVYTRIRYMVERAHHNYEPDVRAVGRRLLKRVPDDYQVLYYQATALDTRIPSERKESFAHANRVTQLRPDDYKSYYLMGDRYRAVWMSNNVDMSKPRSERWSGQKDKTNRDRAISYFREAQKLLPKGHSYRARLDEAIQALLEGRAF